MKLSASTIERQSTMLPDESIEMTIDARSLHVLMSTLSNMYSDNELAVLRELSTNARDAMIEAGRAEFPIEVNLPSAFRQVLIIKDTGIGMDKTDLRNTYSKYGASSKRDSNLYNGQLGLGSKSPFTITDQYTVTAVKNGIRTQVLVGRSEQGGGTMDIVSERPTTERNSVTIEIPTSRRSDFHTKAAGLYKFWEPGTVLVDGKQPETFTGDELEPGLFVSLDNPYYGKDIIVMGNVPYPIQDRINNAYTVTYFAAIGDVDFAPSREALIETSAKTRQTISHIKGRVTDLLKVRLEERLKETKSFSDAVKFHVKYGQLAKNIGVTLKFRGYDMSAGYGHIPHGNIEHHYEHGVKYFGGSSGKIRSIHLASVINSEANVVIVDRDKLSFQQKEKMKAYAAANGLRNNWFVFPREINNIWLSDLNRVDWEDIKAIKLPKVQRAPVAKRGPLAEYKLWDAARLEWTADKIDDTKPVFYVGAGDFKADDEFKTVSATMGNPQIAKVYKVKLKAFQSEFPEAKHLFDGASTFLTDFYKKVQSPDYSDYLCFYYDDNGAWAYLVKLVASGRNMLDTRFKDLYDRLSPWVDTSNQEYAVSRMRARVLSVEGAPKLPTIITGQASSSVENPFKDYPLLLAAVTNHYRPVSVKQAVDYINTMWTINNNTKENEK